LGLTYQESGVNIDAGNTLVKRIKALAANTHRPELLNNLGGFAALASIPEKYNEPILVTGTDGVGTKLALAITHNRLETIGQDLVAMSVNDVLVSGAEPFLFLDYFATGKLDVDVAEKVITGIAKGCEIAGCALAGGETAEMPGFYRGGEFDLAGFCIGLVEKAELVSGSNVEVGDDLIGLTSSGPHSNGYSLIREILKKHPLKSHDPLIDQLIAPTKIYVKSISPLLSRVNGLAHITGGGFIDNIPRMFSSSLAADIDLTSWVPPKIFQWIQETGNIDNIEMLRTFNCGIGFVIACKPQNTEKILSSLNNSGENAQVIGTVSPAGAKPESRHLVVESEGFILNDSLS
jgi:phosphoribosylformylglycinamidine cyclo-ligase